MWNTSFLVLLRSGSTSGSSEEAPRQLPYGQHLHMVLQHIRCPELSAEGKRRRAGGHVKRYGVGGENHRLGGLGSRQLSGALPLPPRLHTSMNERTGGIRAELGTRTRTRTQVPPSRRPRATQTRRRFPQMPMSPCLSRISQAPRITRIHTPTQNLYVLHSS